MAITPVAPKHCATAKAEPAATFPIDTWRTAAAEPAAIPEVLNPAAVRLPAEITPTLPAMAVMNASLTALSIICCLLH